MYQFQTFERSANVFTEVGVPGGERLGLGRRSLLDQGQVGLDRLAQTVIAVAVGYAASAVGYAFVVMPVDHRRTSEILREGPRATASDA